MAKFIISKLIFLICLPCCVNTDSISTSDEPVNFNFTEFELGSTDVFASLNDANVSGNVFHLTGMTNSDHSIGRILYKKPIQLSLIADFSTQFKFVMDYVGGNGMDSGDGIAFFLAAAADAYNIQSFTRTGWFGLVGRELDSLPKIFAIAFDSYQSIVGTFAQNFSGSRNYSGGDYLTHANVSYLNNGTVWNAWIDYNSSAEILNVYLASGSPSLKTPQKCILSETVNLVEYLTGDIMIGFSSAAVESNETHDIYSWSFNSSFLPENSSKGFNSSANGSEMSTSTKIIVGVGSGVVACIAGAMLVWGFFAFLRRRKRAESIRGQKSADMDLDKLLLHIPRRFKMDDLMAGTNNFSDARKLGQGGFGGVYKCILLQTNEILAVKRISEGSRQGIKEFISEVSIVSRLGHRNLVQLVGWCHEGDQLLLVYEYMSNGSLDRHIFTRGGREIEEEEERPVLQWSFRYKIATEIANALLYLHEECDQCVVHRDIKSSNVLLDSSFSAKLGDFGLARMVTHERLAKTTRTAGTLGYLAPECEALGKTSPESDVYSFGVVVLEIASGKKAMDLSLLDFDMRLVVWARDLYAQGRLLEAADVRLNGVFEKEEMEQLMLVGLWCSHPDAAARPKIRQVLKLLNFEVAAPIPPAIPVPSETPFMAGPSSSVASYSVPTSVSAR